MAGITSVGVYVPRYRLSCEEIAKMWRTKPVGGEKAVAGYDEDPVTMAAAAVRECMKHNRQNAEGLYFSTTTAPYGEKQNAAILAGVAGLGKKSVTADFSGSLRAGTTAMKSALDAVKSGSAETVLVAASDCRTGAPRGRFEQILGDGAAALAMGTHGVIAEIEGACSIFSEFTDLWRRQSQRFVRSAEGRFIEDEGYLPAMREAVSALLETYCLRAEDFSRVVFSASDGRQHASLAKKLGFEPSRVQDPLFSLIGHTGTAGALIMLAAALEQAEPGERILFVNYGDGADAFALRATEAVASLRSRPFLKDRLSAKKSIDYGTYLNWRDLVPFEASSLPERGEPSIAGRWRQRRLISSLSGVRCRKCGAQQIHPIGQTVRICVVCQSKDDFDAYCFSDKTARLFTYAIDQLQPTKNPPGLNGVIDFDGGGRLLCELTDYDLDRVEIGMPLEMTFRKMSQSEGIVNYFWKAKPAV